MIRFSLLVLAVAVTVAAQTKKPVEAQSSSSIQMGTDADSSETVQIHNVSYYVTGTNVPGRPPDERLLLKKTVQSKQVLGDIGMESTFTLEAWRLGDDPREKPLYTLTASGEEGQVKDNALVVVPRGLEEVEWWSVYQLGNGAHSFDTYVPLVSFSISRETLTMRYAGLEVPPDDIQDPRLKQPNVIAVVTYASEGKVLQEALLTSDDREQATLLRSFADVTRSMSTEEAAPARTLRLSFRQNYPSPSNPLAITIPIAHDRLDLANAKLPAKMHLSAWKR